MNEDRERLLDELARAYTQAAVDRLLAEAGPQESAAERGDGPEPEREPSQRISEPFKHVASIAYVADRDREALALLSAPAEIETELAALEKRVQTSDRPAARETS